MEYQPTFAQVWAHYSHQNRIEAFLTLQAEGIRFGSIELAWRYQTAQADCQAFAQEEDWPMVTAMLEEMASIKREDALAAMEAEEAYYASSDYQAKLDAAHEAENAERDEWFDHFRQCNDMDDDGVCQGLCHWREERGLA